VIQKFWKPETPALLNKISALLEDTSDFSVENLDNVVKGFIQNNNLGMGQIMNTLRLVLVGGSFGPGVAAIISLLGKDETVNRISKALEKLG